MNIQYMREVEVSGLNQVLGEADLQRQAQNEPQILLILIGLPGSGKTTFAEALIRDRDPNRRKRRWIRASQDDAPSRRRQECEAVTRNGLRDGRNVIVDRVGFDATQRSHFINIAYQHAPRPRIYALYLSVSVPSLEERLSLRTIHPTLSDPKLAMMVLRDMTRQLRVPTPEACEGFDKIYTLDESLQPQGGKWQEEDTERVLGLLEAEGEVETGPRRIIEARPAMNAGRGRGFDPSRAGYGGRGGRGDSHGYRGRGGYGYGRGDGPRQEGGRTWNNDREHRPYPQPGPQPHLGPPVGQRAYRPYANANAHPYIPPPSASYPASTQQDNRPV